MDACGGGGGAVVAFDVTNVFQSKTVNPGYSGQEQTRGTVTFSLYL